MGVVLEIARTFSAFTEMRSDLYTKRKVVKGSTDLQGDGAPSLLWQLEVVLVPSDCGEGISADRAGQHDGLAKLELGLVLGHGHLHGPRDEGWGKGGKGRRVKNESERSSYSSPPLFRYFISYIQIVPQLAFGLGRP